MENDIFGKDLTEDSAKNQQVAVIADSSESIDETSVSESTEEISEETEGTSVSESESESDEAETSEEGDLDSEETDGEESADLEEDDRPICMRCEKGKIEEGHDYCEKCEQELLKTKIPFTAWIYGVLSIFISLAAFVIVCLVSAPALQVVEGDMEASDKNWYNAYTAYSGIDDVISEVTDILGDNIISRSVIKGCGVKAKQFESVVHCYSPLDAISYMSYIFDSEDDGYIQHHKGIQKYSALSDRYKNTYSALEGILSGIQSSDDIDGDKVISDMETLRGTEGVDDVFLDYFIYNVAGYCGFDDEKVLTYIEKIDKTAKSTGEELSWLYYGIYADTLIKCGREDEAIPLLKELAADDVSDGRTYIKILKIYLMQKDYTSAENLIDEFSANNPAEGTEADATYIMRIMLAKCKGDYVSAQALATEALSFYDSTPELNRQQALIHLYNGDYGKAYDQAFLADDTAYMMYYYYGDSSSYTDEVIFTLYLSAYLCDKNNCETENGDYLSEIIDSYKDAPIPEKIQSIVDGKTDVKTVLSEGVCDLL